MKKFNRWINWRCCAAMLFLIVGQKTSAQSDTSGLVNRPLFTSDSTIAVTIEGPFQTIMRNRDEAEEFPATLKYTAANGTQRTLDIRLRARGKFRRNRETCNFAPLRVNFQKEQVKGTVFGGQDKIKLVTDCQRSRSIFQQYLLKEYLAYKVYKSLTDRSFGARLIRVTYVDSDRKGKARDSYAFFIEDKNHIAERLGMTLVDIAKTRHRALDPAHSNLVTVFEYFIGNTDFSLIAGPAEENCCHNAVLYQKESGPYISIPYDFDHAGIVDAPYAAPNPRFKLRSVKQRLYRGRCANNAHLDSTFQQFIDKRDDIRQLVQQLDGFDDRAIKKTMSFIDGLYKDISSPKAIEKKFIKKCS